MRYNELLLAGRPWEGSPMAGHFRDVEAVSFIKEEMRGNPALLLAERVPIVRFVLNGHKTKSRNAEIFTFRHMPSVRRQARRKASVRPGF